MNVYALQARCELAGVSMCVVRVGVRFQEHLNLVLLKVFFFFINDLIFG